MSIYFFARVEAFPQIQIEVNPSMGGKKFNINIQEGTLTYDLQLNILDSISHNPSYLNESEKLRKEFMKYAHLGVRKDIVHNIINRLNSLQKENTIYQTYTTSVTRSFYPDYFDLISLILSSSKESLERREENKNRFVLDGYGVSVHIMTEERDEIVSVRSPTEMSHPEISDLLKSTLDIFKDKKLISTDNMFNYGLELNFK